MFILNANKEIIEVRRPAFNAPKSSPISENCSRCGELVIKHTTKATLKHEGTKEKQNSIALSVGRRYKFDKRS